MESFGLLVVLPILSLLLAALLPSSMANAHVKALRTTVTLLVLAQWLLSLALAIAFLSSRVSPMVISPFGTERTWHLGFDIYYDAATALMLVLVSFVGFIVSRFSIRYLDGEAMQGRYFRWLSFAIGAVSLMVVAGNLLLFFAAWVMTSFGLHQLLLHYRHREAAHRAAWTKFAISRLGDAFLIGALVLTFGTFGTFEMSLLFERAKDLSETAQVTASHVAIGWFIVLGAVTKSAQFPFHTWLPNTMETPTPVSALMHAGIVNAGGYLIIRMSPLVALAPTALMTLAAIGAFTACFAAVVMMTQSSVKRTLAYSTIAQMGFMMLQCGLGAFSAAMLHILAHSLYKAHAFLGSGSVISQSLATAGAKSANVRLRKSTIYLICAATATLLVYTTVAAVSGLNVTNKPGGIVLACILCIALTTWVWRLLSQGNPAVLATAGVGLVLLSLSYVGSYLFIDRLFGQASAVAQIVPNTQLITLFIPLIFASLFALHAVVFWQLRPRWLEAIRVHAMNGFYVDAIYHRIFARSN